MMMVRSVLLIVAVAAVAALADQPPSAVLMATHAALDKEVEDLTKEVASASGDIAALQKEVPKLRASVEGAYLPDKAKDATEALSKYYTFRREQWIAERNKEFAQKMINRLVERVPKVREMLKPLYADYIQAERIFDQMVEQKELSWHARRMATLNARLADDLRKEAKANKAGLSEAVLNTKRSQAADAEAKAVSFTNVARDATAKAAVLRSQVVDECVMTSRLECNGLLRNYLVGANRLWTAYRNKQLAVDELKTLEPLAEEFRVAAVEDVFKERTTGIGAFRMLRNKWIEIWTVERHRAITEQQIARKKLRMERIWAELNRYTQEVQNSGALGKKDKSEPVAADLAEQMGDQKVIYQATVGRQQPASQTRPVTQFSGPNTDPDAFLEQKLETAAKKN